VADDEQRAGLVFAEREPTLFGFTVLVIVALKASGSRNTVAACSKETPCLARLPAAFTGSQAKR
jgi:hypothetical protein